MTMPDLDRPAFEHPALRKAVADVLSGTVLEQALAHNDIAELVTNLIDAYALHSGARYAITDVFTAAGVEDDYAYHLAGKVDAALLDASATL